MGDFRAKAAGPGLATVHSDKQSIRPGHDKPSRVQSQDLPPENHIFDTCASTRFMGPSIALESQKGYYRLQNYGPRQARAPHGGDRGI